MTPDNPWVGDQCSALDLRNGLLVAPMLVFVAAPAAETLHRITIGAGTRWGVALSDQMWQEE